MAPNRRYANVTLADRFWPKVDVRKPDECWQWLGAKDSHGYGHIYEDGRKRPAHRVSWEIHHGQQFPNRLLACHHCDDPGCVNPHHIFPGTMRDNVQDAIAKRGKWGPPRHPVCSKGHAVEGDNAYVTTTGRIRCRQCVIDNSRNWRLVLAAEPETRPV